MAYYEGEIAPIGGGCNNNNGFGNGWEGLIGLALVAGLFDGGFGFGNGNNGAALTRADLCQDMNFNNLESAVRGVQQGLCDGFYAMNTSLLTGFGNTQTAIMQNGYETRNAISDLGYRQQQCCCETQRAIDGVNYNMAKNTCDITNAINGSTQQILGFLTQEKISALQAENSLLTAQLSQNSQTQNIINALRPTAVPAYITCSPYESSYGFGYGRSGYGYNNNSGCGCGCGCGCAA